METRRNHNTARRFTAVGSLLIAFVFALAASSALGQVPAPKKRTRGAQSESQKTRRPTKKPGRRSSRKKKTTRATPTTPARGNKPTPTPTPGSKKKATPGSKRDKGAAKKGAPAKQDAPANPVEEFGIDPEVQKKIDDMFKARGQTSPSEVLRRSGADRSQRGSTSTKRDKTESPTSPGRSGSTPVPRGAAAKDALTPLDIAPDEDLTPPEDRTYGFAIKNGTYAQLVEGFARQTGLGVIGSAPAGSVTFVTTEKLTFDQALGRLRMILFNFKTNEPYWVERTRTHLQIIRVTDLYRILPLKRMYPSIEAFLAANLPDDEIALAVYTPKAGSVANLNQLRDWLPDYVRISPLGDQNRLTIFALVSDINKYLDLIKLFPGEGDDPRVIERIKIQFVSPSDALSKLGTIMKIDGGGGGGGARSVPRGRGRSDTGSLQNIAEPPVSIIPDDSQGVLIVRAMQNKIDEMKRVLQYIDVDMSAQNPPPEIIAIEHATAEDIVPVIQRLISASSSPGGGGGGAAPKRSRRPRKSKSSGTVELATADSVTLLAHPSKNAIIVFAADEAGFDEVRRFVEMLDVSGDVGWTRIAFKHAGAETIKSTLEQMIPTTTGRGSKKESTGHQFVLDPSGDGLWYTGPEETLEKINEIIAIIDVEQEPIALHSTRLVYRKPSFVVDMIKLWEGSSDRLKMARVDVAAKKPRRTGSVGGKSTPTLSGSFTADDNNMILFALCSDSKWDDYLGFIKTVDTAMNLAAPFQRIAVQYIGAEKAADELSRIIGTNTFEAGIRLVPASGSLLIIGANPQDIEQIKIFLAEIDVPSQIENRTYTIRFAEPGEIKEMIETLVADAPAPKRSGQARKRGGGKSKPVASSSPIPVAGGSLGSTEMTIIEYGNKLIVRATPDQHQEVAAIIAEFDVRDGQPELKVYDDFPPGADIEGITETIRSVLTGSKQPKRGRRRPKDAATGAAIAKGPQFIPQASSGRLIVIAEPALFPEIERLLDVLRIGSAELEIIVAIIPVVHADAEDLIEQIEPILELKVKNLVVSGELGGDGEESVKTKARAQLRGRVSKSSSDRYHLNADNERRQIVVAAPQVIVDEIQALVLEFDKPTDKGELVFRTVNLTNASPGEMIRALKEMTGKTTVRRLNRGKQGGGSGAGQSTPTGESLTIVEVPGGGAIILRGLEEDVDQAEKWIHKLDALSSPDRQIKVYQIKTADITKLFDLIINVVEMPMRTAGSRVQRRAGRTKTETEDDADTFSTSKSYSSQDVYIQADLIGRTMLVAATAGKAQRIDDLITRFDSQEEGADQLVSAPSIPKFIYELKFADPLDASWELEEVLTTLWEPQDQIPQVEAALFGDFLVIRYPDATRFDDVREMIRKYVDIPDPDQLKIVRWVRPALKGMKASDVVRILADSIAGVRVEVQDVTPKKQKTYGIEEILPPSGGGSNPCVLPAAFHTATTELLASITAAAQNSPKKKGDDVATKKKKKLGKTKTFPQGRTPPAKQATEKDADSMIRNAVLPIIEEKKVKKRTTNAEQRKEDRPATAKKMPEGQLVKLRWNDEEGIWFFEGPEGILPDIEAILADMKEEIENLPVAPDIRIYRVRYIDVYSAMDIINEMFNATRQQRQQVLNQQRQQQRQQQQQQRQQQQRNQRGQEGGDQRGQQRNQRAQQQRQQQATIQLPPTAVRVYPNPRDRTLILRADTSQYPQIRKLLATIDQPKPIDSFMRTYPLKNLNAAEVEEMLKDMLGLNVAAQRRGRTTRPRTGGNRQGGGGGGGASVSSGQAGAQLPETILQSTVSGKNQLEVDPGDIKLFSSETTNSIMVMAPTAALDYIGKIIEELDRKDRLPGRMTKYYTLEHAEAGEIVEYLASHFGTEGGKGGGGKSGQGITRIGDSPNDPTIIGYPRLNQITVIANQSQIDEIEPIIKRLDVRGITLATETITLQFANPEDVAESINLIFEDRQKALKSLESRTTVSPLEYTVVVTPDVQTKQIIVQASATNMELVRARITQMDTETATALATEIRTYPIKFADSNTVVNVINQWAKSRTQSGRRQRTVLASDAVLATADLETQVVIVVASAENHIIVADLIERLDDEKLATRRRTRQVLRLEHASATEVANQLTQVFRNAVRRQRSDRGPTFIADPKTNFIIADVNDEEFAEVTDLLAKIDVEPPYESERTTEVYPLRYADPRALNAVVVNMFRGTGRSQPSPSEQVTSSVEGETQSLIVTASAKNHEVIKALIEKVDDEKLVTQLRKRQVLRLTHASAAEVASQLTQVFRNAVRRQRSDRGPTFIADPKTNFIIADVNDEEFAEITELLAEIDIEPPLAGERTTEVYPLRYADPGSLNRVVLNMFRWDVRSQPSPSEQVTSAVEGATQTLIVTASAKNHARIREFIEKVDIESNMGKNLQIYKLEKANADDVAKTLQQAYRGRKSTRRGDQPVQITPEPSTNSLLIFANATEMTELEALIKSIDVEPSGQDVNVVDLKHADADALAKTLTELYGKRGRGRGTGPGTIITAISGSRALVIKTNPAEFGRIQATIAELDSEDSAAGGEVRMVTLLYADANEILSAMKEYLRKAGGRGRGELSGDVRLSAMGSSNSIMVAGALEEVERLEVIIKAMDSVGEKGSVPQIIPIQYANVGMIVASLQEIYRNAGRRGGRNYQPPVIVADEMGNNLIVRASPVDLQSIEELVAKIDTKDKQDLTPYKIISLPAGMNPDDTADMVERTINETARQRAAGLRGAQVASITVSSDRRTNSITLAGSASLFADAEAMIKQLEEMGPPGGTTTRVLRVRNVAVDDIQRLIDQLTQQGSGGSRGSARRGGGRRSSGPARRSGGGRRRR